MIRVVHCTNDAVYAEKCIFKKSVWRHVRANNGQQLGEERQLQK